MINPDVIKKSLACCKVSDCDRCHYNCYATLSECGGALADDTLDYINQLEQRLSSVGKTCPEWISVEERKPEGEGVVLVANFAPGTDGYKKMDVADVFDAGNSDITFYLLNGFDVEYDVTHWMPLPEPPKEDEPS